MQKIWLPTALLAVAFLTGCKKEEHPVTDAKTDFDITFRATYDGEQVRRYTNYSFDGAPIQFTGYALFLSDITLLKGTEEIRLSEIEYVNFFPSNLTSDLSDAPVLTFEQVPEGEYTGIRLGFGVKPALNALNPGNFRPGEPLFNEFEYWAGWDSYIFSRIDGSYDPNSDGVFETTLVYHCGGDGVYREFTFEKPIHIHAGAADLGIDFDLKKMFVMPDGSLYDIVTNYATSNNPNNIVVASVLMDQYQRATVITP